jgi:hypothetical protein
MRHNRTLRLLHDSGSNIWDIEGQRPSLQLLQLAAWRDHHGSLTFLTILEPA